jgi:hypothetical protein
MKSASDLYVMADGIGEVPQGLPLVAALTGFADAGAAVSQFTDAIREELAATRVATFENDELLDYRARRPIISFDQDHLSDYSPARLSLDLLVDELGRPFLLLSGYEPDYQWERFTRAVRDLIERFGVASTTWVHSIPMPVPHTRPIGVTVSGNRADLAEAMSVWRPSTQAPANALHLLEFSLYETELSVAGFVLLIPHYLSDTEYPDAAVKALECITAATGLIFPSDRLREDGREFVSRIDAQVTENGELAKLVGVLEERHDAYMEGNAVRSPLTDEDGALPTADEIAAELEKFLATRKGDDDPLMS